MIVPRTMNFEYWAATDPGRKRSHNEDNFLIDADLHLFVVADGLGGHSAGEVASAMAVHAVRDVVERERAMLEPGYTPPQSLSVEICTLLEYAVHVACEKIHERALREPEKRGMATTLLAMLIRGSRAYIAHVGDSRIYLLRDGIVYQLTEDHSLANELARQGKTSSGGANVRSHAMTRAVGPGRLVDVDTLDFDLREGDALLLCTDGLYEYIESRDIENAMRIEDIQAIPPQLVGLANARGGRDNITAVVVRLGSLAEQVRVEQSQRSALASLRKVDLFATLNPPQLQRILEAGRFVDAPPDQILFREGESADAFHVILEGEIELRKRGVLLAKLGSGHHFGEMGLIDEQPRSADARTTTPARIFAMLRRDFHDILRSDSDIAVKLLWGLLSVLNRRLRQTTGELAKSGPKPAVPPEAERRLRVVRDGEQ